MTERVVDIHWCVANPLPVPEPGTDKNGRGRVLVAGGSELVPGALRLTGEAALRAGAGKLRMATVRSVSLLLGIQVPEAAVMDLPTDDQGDLDASAGDLLREAAGFCDAFILGPGMGTQGGAEELVRRALIDPQPGLAVVLDAAAISSAANLIEVVRAHHGQIVMTPHYGEMARLTGMPEAQIAEAPIEIARSVAERFQAVVALKADRTVIAAPDGMVLSYGSDCVGLATSGSGDVLAGIIGGLLARGAPPLTATAWGVWLHGEAGKVIASRTGPIGFLARELIEVVPSLMAIAAPACIRDETPIA